MKKLLILMLVLGMASLANATVTYEIREADGVTPANPLGLNLSLDYTVVISGVAADAPHTGGVYFTGWVASDIVDLVARGPLDGTNYTGSSFDAAGDMAVVFYTAAYFGYDITAADAVVGVPPDLADGDWFIFDLLPKVLGSETLEFFDYAVSYDVPVSTIGLTVIPEPMTIALLGLGGLFLLRRRK